MNDDQCQALIDAIHFLTKAVEEGSEKIANVIDGQYHSDNGGIEKRLEKLIDAIYESSGSY